MMLVGVLASAGVLLVVISVVLLRALAYLQQHPELVETGIPMTYIYCQRTLNHVINRYHALDDFDRQQVNIAWQSPGGYEYIVTDHGIDQRRGSSHRYYLTWAEVGGVGVRMQPGFRFADRNRDGAADSRYTTGYTFYLLIVPLSGRTLNIQIPTGGEAEAIDFTARVLALADRERKRINVFGFNKPPAPRRQRVPRY